ncbi:hypothetical protein OROMI_003372 [Orobanche minor]
METTTPHEAHSQIQNSTPPPSSSSTARLWRPAAQRNMRNQWSELNSLCQEWRSAASTARSHATAIVNSYLSQKYMDDMDFGVLNDMPNIRKKACSKLLKQQELFRGKLLSSYRAMVSVVTHMVSSCKTMRCYFRGASSSPLAQFSFSSEDNSNSGDCDGIPVFTFYSISFFVKRLLVMELLSIYDEKVTAVTKLHWSDEFYDGESNELGILKLYSDEARQPILPCLGSCKSTTSILRPKQQRDSNVLQVYITTWLVEANIDGCRDGRNICYCRRGDACPLFLIHSVDELNPLIASPRKQSEVA